MWHGRLGYFGRPWRLWTDPIHYLWYFLLGSLSHGLVRTWFGHGRSSWMNGAWFSPPSVAPLSLCCPYHYWNHYYYFYFTHGNFSLINEFSTWRCGVAWDLQMLVVWETAPPACFYWMLGQTHVNGWSRVIASQNGGSTSYISPFRLRVLQWSRHLFNYWKNKKTMNEKFLILLIWNWIYIDYRKITWLWS